MSVLTVKPVLYIVALSMAIAGCTGVVEAPDEGASSTAVAVCSSNVFWKDLDKGSEFMRPGGKCNDCHSLNIKAPALAVAGTVYPTAHEPDECNGVVGVLDAKGIPETSVIITDRTGRTLPAIPVNSVGNFQRTEAVIAPFNVKVVSKGKENKMVMQAPHGDCNACHTQSGAEGAPGRIVALQP